MTMENLSLQVQRHDRHETAALLSVYRGRSFARKRWASARDVDLSRLATLGMSMGSTVAWWVAVLDERVGVCVDLCCLTDFQALIETQGLDRHGLYYYVPGRLNHFTTAEINALIASRLRLGLTGTRDPLTPPAGLDRIDARLQQVYAEAGPETSSPFQGAAWEATAAAAGALVSGSARYLSMIGASSGALTRL